MRFFIRGRNAHKPRDVAGPIVRSKTARSTGLRSEISSIHFPALRRPNLQLLTPLPVQWKTSFSAIRDDNAAVERDACTLRYTSYENPLEFELVAENEILAVGRKADGFLFFSSALVKILRRCFSNRRVGAAERRKVVQREVCPLESTAVS